MDNDLAAYIRKEIVDDPDLSYFTEDDPELEEEIVKGLIERAQNMFLLV